MFDKTGVKIIGLIDNMSYFKGDDGKKYKIFGEGGVKKTAQEFNLPYNEYKTTRSALFSHFKFLKKMGVQPS